MKRLVLGLLPAVLLAAGCGAIEPRYTKSDMTEQKAKEELDSCRADSLEGMPEGGKGVRSQERDQKEVVDQCMKAKGITK